MFRVVIMETTDMVDYNISLDLFEFSLRTINVLKSNNIQSDDELLDLDKATVLGWKNAGPRVWEEILNAQIYINTNPIEHNILSLVRYASIWNNLMDTFVSTFPNQTTYQFEMDKSGLIRCWKNIELGDHRHG